MSESNNQSKWILRGIAGALAAWGLFLAVGAYLAGDGDRSHDFRKLWVVAGMVAAFLMLWGGALAVRARKLRQKTPKD